MREKYAMDEKFSSQNDASTNGFYLSRGKGISMFEANLQWRNMHNKI